MPDGRQFGRRGCLFMLFSSSIKDRSDRIGGRWLRSDGAGQESAVSPSDETVAERGESAPYNR